MVDLHPLRRDHLALLSRNYKWIRHVTVDEDLLVWHILFDGAEQSPYEKGVYLLRVSFLWHSEDRETYFPNEIVFPLCPVLRHPYDYWLPTARGILQIL